MEEAGEVCGQRRTRAYRHEFLCSMRGNNGTREVKFFEDKETGRDDHYRERKVLLTAFAEVLPDREPASKHQAVAGQAPAKQAPVLQPVSNSGDIPF